MSKPLILFIIPGACAFGSQALLEWSKTPYNIVITTAEMRTSEAFRKVNPLGKIGALKDGDFIISQSLAILYYLANKYNKFADTELNLEQKALVFQWLEYSSTSLHAAFSPCFHPERFVSQEIIEEYKKSAIERLNQALTYVNDYLADKEYFVANRLTIADLQLYGILRWIERVFEENHQYNNIRKFRQRIEQEQIIKNALAIEKEDTNNLQDSSFQEYITFN